MLAFRSVKHSARGGLPCPRPVRPRHGRASLPHAAVLRRAAALGSGSSSNGGGGNASTSNGNGHTHTSTTSSSGSADTNTDPPTREEAAAAAADRYGWRFDGAAAPAPRRGARIEDVPIDSIRRPLGRTRSNDQDKVRALMDSIAAIGLQEPIDVLLVDGVYYGFNGCHRFEAHQRLGLTHIRCRVMRASKETLRMHLM